MKLFFSLLAILMLNKECDKNKSTDVKSTTVNSEKSSNVMQDNTIIWYEATTRGFYEKIWVTKDSITVTHDRYEKEKITYKTEESDWNELMNLLKGIDVKSLPELEAPTSMRHYDGAAIATLAVNQNSEEIKSSNFDHGHPPKSVESLVNKVISMKEIHQKN